MRSNRSEAGLPNAQPDLFLLVHSEAVEIHEGTIYALESALQVNLTRRGSLDELDIGIFRKLDRAWVGDVASQHPHFVGRGLANKVVNDWKALCSSAADDEDSFG